MASAPIAAATSTGPIRSAHRCANIPPRRCGKVRRDAAPHPDHRRLGFRRRRGHPGRHQDRHHARRPRDDRDHRGHRAEHAGRPGGHAGAGRDGRRRRSMRSSTTSASTRSRSGCSARPQTARCGGRAARSAMRRADRVRSGDGRHQRRALADDDDDRRVRAADAARDDPTPNRPNWTALTASDDRSRVTHLRRRRLHGSIGRRAVLARAGTGRRLIGEDRSSEAGRPADRLRRHDLPGSSAAINRGSNAAHHGTGCTLGERDRGRAGAGIGLATRSPRARSFVRLRVGRARLRAGHGPMGHALRRVAARRYPQERSVRFQLSLE